MVLVDHQIELRCKGTSGRTALIDPFRPELLQPASYDVTLATTFQVDVAAHREAAIDPQSPDTGLELVKVDPGECFLLHPHQFVLGATCERFMVEDDMVMRIEGKSSLARIGLAIHATGGFVDPGFRGTLTLELSNLRIRPIVLRPGMPIAQVAFFRASAPARCSYTNTGRYVDQDEATASRYGWTRDTTTAGKWIPGLANP